MKKAIILLSLAALMIMSCSAVHNVSEEDHKVVNVQLEVVSMSELWEAAALGRSHELLFPHGMKPGDMFDVQYLVTGSEEQRMTYGAYKTLVNRYGEHARYTYAECLSAKLDWCLSVFDLSLDASVVSSMDSDSVLYSLDRYATVLDLADDTDVSTLVNNPLYMEMREQFIVEDIAELDLFLQYDSNIVFEAISFLGTEHKEQIEQPKTEYFESEIEQVEEWDGLSPTIVLGEKSVSDFESVVVAIPTYSERIGFKEILMAASILLVGSLGVYAAVKSFVN